MDKPLYYFLFILLICASFQTNAQKNNKKFTGKIMLPNNHPASFVNVSLKNNKMQAVADQNGIFFFNQPVSLSDTIVISGIGLKTKKQFINFSNETHKDLILEIEFEINHGVNILFLT